MPKIKTTFVDLFAGAGYMGLGFTAAGFDCVAAVEIEKNAAASHRRNHPGVPVIEADIREVGRREIYKAAGLNTEKIDVVVGSPPCQPWSIQGHNNPSDCRRSLLDEFLRVVVELRPKHFIMENVPGLTQGKNRAVLEALIAEFSLAGYDCTPWQLLNARNHGVAQDRKRLFLLGSRRDCYLIEYPEHQPPVTCQDVLEDLEDPEAARLLSGWEKTAHTPEVLERFAQVPLGGHDKVSRFKRLHPDGVCNTLTAGTAKGNDWGGRYTPKRPIHYLEPARGGVRVITVREAARLSSVPDHIELGLAVMGRATALAQIGNGVPPNFAKAVALKCLEAIKNAQV